MVDSILLRLLPIILLAWACTSFVLPYVVRTAVRLGIIDFPDQRRIHASPIPRAGGAALVFGFHIAALLAFVIIPSESAALVGLRFWAALSLGTLVVASVGMVDDIVGIRPFSKLLGQCCATLILLASGLHLGSIGGIPLTAGQDFVICMLWIVLVTNAYNLIDGLDGLASGLATISSCALAFSFAARGYVPEAALCLALAASCVGFLRYNRYPARVFLGDTGSNFIGFLLGAMTLVGWGHGTAAEYFWLPVCALAVPLMDTGLAVLRRSIAWIRAIGGGNLRPKGVMSADLKHLHHCFLNTGRSQHQVVALLCALQASIAISAVLSLLLVDELMLYWNAASISLFVVATLVLGGVIRHARLKVPRFVSGAFSLLFEMVAFMAGAMSPGFVTDLLAAFRVSCSGLLARRMGSKLCNEATATPMTDAQLAAAINDVLRAVDVSIREQRSINAAAARRQEYAARRALENVEAGSSSETQSIPE